MKNLNMLKAIFSVMILLYILAFIFSSKAHGKLQASKPYIYYQFALSSSSEFKAHDQTLNYVSLYQQGSVFEIK